MIHSSTQSDQRHERLIQSLLFYITQYKTLYSCPRSPCVSHEHHMIHSSTQSDQRHEQLIQSRVESHLILVYSHTKKEFIFTSFFSFMLLFSAAISQSTNIFRVSFELFWWEGHRSKLNVFLSVQWLIIIIILLFLSSAISEFSNVIDSLLL